MTIILNGQPLELSDVEEHSLQKLVEDRSMKAERVAIERNGEIVPRPLWQATQLQSGDKVEIVHFVGGGSDLLRCTA